MKNSMDSLSKAIRRSIQELSDTTLLPKLKSYFQNNFRIFTDNPEIFGVVILLSMTVGWLASIEIYRQTYMEKRHCALSVFNVRDVAQQSKYKSGRFEVCAAFDSVP